MTNFPRVIAYFARAESRLFHLSVIRQLVDRFGCEIHFYCNGVEQVDFYRKRPEASLLSSIQDGAFLLNEALVEPEDPAAALSEAQRIEDRIGRPYARLTSANRHLGRGFSPGGFYHPRSHTSEKATPNSILSAYNKVLTFFFDEFEKKGIELAINPYKEAAVVAHTLDIPYRLMAGSRYHNLHYWAWNEHFDNPMFLERYRALKSSGTPPTADLKRPYDAHVTNRTAFFKSLGLLPALRKSARVVAQFAYWRYKGYEKGRLGYLFRDMVRLPLRQYRDYNRLKSIATTRLDDIKGKPYVFFPLHLEPEAALQIISPEYLHQLGAITSLARELPTGVHLAVKEAFGMIGRRPTDFYRQLLEHKNVVLLRTDEQGVDCVRQAVAVSTISGSAGLEACVAGRPVISFGRHNMYNVLDSVTVIKDEADLYPVLRTVCAGEYDPKDIREEGRRFLDAVVAESFDMGQYDYKDMASFAQENVDACVDKLVESVRSELPAPPPY